MTKLNKIIILSFVLTLFFLGTFMLRPITCLGWFYLGPSISELAQIKSDNETLIEENGITTEDTVVFKAKVFAPTGSGKIEVEIRQILESFTGIDDGGIIGSDFVAYESTVFAVRSGLINGQYHWRARVVDSVNDTSSWQEFGAEGNVDFEVKLVPLYTQVISDINPESINWFNKEYANGLGDTGDNPCGLQIKDCGCAITSAVMLLRYHGITSNVRDYNNQFDGLRLYSPLVSGGPVDGISFTLASPAELLVTDSLGRRLGKDPITNLSHNEIPGGSYGSEGIGNADSEISISTHKVKNIWIPQPIAGGYTIKVIGTDTGTYTLESLVYDSQSHPHSQTLTGNTQSNLITNYTFNFTPDQPENIIIRPIDDIPPEAKIYFDKENKTLKIEGVDNLSQAQVIQTDKVFIINDEAGNTLKLNFEELKQRGKEVKAELESLQYNNQSIIGLPETELKFDIKAKYNYRKDETRVEIIKKRQKKEKQILQGLAIVKLITKSGELNFEF